MLKNLTFKKIIPLCLVICMMSSIIVSAANNNTDIDEVKYSLLEDILDDTDQIKETSEGVLYIFDELGGTVLEKIDDSNTVSLLIKEADGLENEIIIANNNIFLNGEQIQSNYNTLIQENNNGVSPRLTTRYYETDSGNPADYTVYGYTDIVPDINLRNYGGAITTTIILGLLGKIVAGLAFTASVASAVATFLAAKDSKGASCMVQHYYREGWPNGWYMGSFAEMLVTRWYSEKDFGGDVEITTHYRTGISY